jgi:putative serine protease PepD
MTRVAAVAGTVAVAAGGVAGGYIARGTAGNSTTTIVRTAAPASSSAQNAAAKSALSVNAIYRAARTGVVEVISTEQSQQQSTFPFGNGGGGGGQSTAQGSGYVYDDAGHVVTNQHVVDGATSVKVQFFDGKTVSATVVGTDPSTDVAVLKVASLPSNVKPLTTGSSSSLQVGDGVVAIGAPFGLPETVTTGIVSALDRDIQAPNNFTISGAIQTDAAINHGNSGGPLLNLQSQVVGVNAQIESDSGGNDGVGFAIPSDTVKSIADRLISSGKVEHAYLGVQIGDAPNGGAQVGAVTSGSPADKAGLQKGDVITAVDGKSVASANALTVAVGSHAVGDKVELTIQRNGTTKTITATLGSRPSA